MRRKYHAVILVTMLAVTLSGCWFAENPSADNFYIVNDTNRPIRFTSEAGWKILVSADGGNGRFPQKGCFDYRLQAIWPSGTVVAVLDQEYCDDQTWTISGKDDWTLE